MHAILRTRPDSPGDNYTASHQGRGQDYDANFTALPMRKLMWQLEQDALVELLGQIRPRTVVDIACGTGRITEVLARVLPDADVRGMDIAPSMIEVARQRASTAQFEVGDVGAMAERVGPGAVDLVTAFRFFPNADVDLRDRAFESAAVALRPGGHLLFNNHRGFWSSSYVVRRLRNGRNAPGAVNAQLLGMAKRQGFQVVAHRSLGIWPQSEERSYGLDNRRAERVERWNATRASRRHRAGYNTLWLLQRSAG